MLIVKIEYDTVNPSLTRVLTNAKDEAVAEILSAFVQGQVGAGRDDSVPAGLGNKWTLTVGLDVADDTLYSKSNTGNKGMDCGIAASVLRLLADRSIQIGALP